MDRGAVGASLRKQAGTEAPREAIVREASLEESDRAFADDGGSVPRNEARRRSGRDAGVYLEPPGGKNVRTVPDTRALENMRQREAKRKGQNQQTTSQPATAVDLALEDDHEDWEETAPVSEPPESPPVKVVVDSNDLLERAKLRALDILTKLPIGVEVFVSSSGLDQAGVEFVMGLGLLIGKGQAVYRGDGHYRLKEGIKV